MKMRPKQFSPEQLAAVKVESGKQTPENITPKSTDPINFPVFEVPVNQKLLVYVPNHTDIDPDTGEEVLRMDKPLFHSVINGKRYERIRCIRGLPTETGYSGECPLCNGESEPWDLANEQIKEQCKQRGLDVNDSESEAVKSIKRDFYTKRVIKAPESYYTFPIVVIETDPGDIKKIIMGDDGTPKHKAYWYTISKSAYEKKWGKTLEGMEDEPTHPGGEFFILNYTYESKSGEWNKRDSARELQVVPKKLKQGGVELAALLDKETEGWDVLKAIETIYDNMYFEEEDIKEKADQVLASTREKLALFETAALPAGSGEGFRLTASAPITDDDDEINGLPMVGATDED